MFRRPGNCSTVLSAPGRTRSGAASQPTVQIVCRADQAQMSECLREVSERFSGRSDFFCVKTDVICVGEHLFENQSSFIEASGTSEDLHCPERADAERALGSGQAVANRAAQFIAVHQT